MSDELKEPKELKRLITSYGAAMKDNDFEEAVIFGEKKSPALSMSLTRQRLMLRGIGGCAHKKDDPDQTPRIDVVLWTCEEDDEGIKDNVNEGEAIRMEALDATIDAAIQSQGVKS